MLMLILHEGEKKVSAVANIVLKQVKKVNGMAHTVLRTGRRLFILSWKQGTGYYTVTYQEWGCRRLQCTFCRKWS